jgi:hypothetical protein
MSTGSANALTLLIGCGQQTAAPSKQSYADALQVFNAEGQELERLDKQAAETVARREEDDGKFWARIDLLRKIDSGSLKAVTNHEKHVALKNLQASTKADIKAIEYGGRPPSVPEDLWASYSEMMKRFADAEVKGKALVDAQVVRVKKARDAAEAAEKPMTL